MRRDAFTLLETLLAVTLTVSVGIAALALTTMQARIGATARAQEESLALITETVRLLDEDLLLAAAQPAGGRFLLPEHAALRLVTAARLPGEPAGLHEVVWTFAPETGTVLRSSTPLGTAETTSRQVGRGWRAFAIGLDRELLRLEAQTGASPEVWSLPLWTEDR